MSQDNDGRVVWITGLAGAGKTTVAGHLQRLLRERTPAVVRLDGDEFRAVMGNDLGYDDAGRIANAWRLGRLCRYLSGQGIHVVIATMSLFKECHDWNRANIPGYFEVFLQVDRETLIARNRKGLYTAAMGGTATNVVGVDQNYDLPESPDLVWNNDGSQGGPETCAVHIFHALGDLRIGR